MDDMKQKGAIWWQDLSWPQVESILKERTTVLLPIGSTEQHGRHLPLGVDVYIPMGIATKVSAATGLPILPPLWYAPCSWHQKFPGTVHIAPETLISLVTDICCSLGHYGVKHVIGINGHTGGCDSTLLVAADKVIERSGARFWIASVVDIASNEILNICDSPVLGHADEVETAKMLAVRPDLVRLDNVTPSNNQPNSNFLSINYRSHGPHVLFRLNSDDWKAVAPEGYIGDPTAATAEKGSKMIDAIVKNLIEFVKELDSWPALMSNKQG
jgi:creatinine amidohydrolase